VVFTDGRFLKVTEYQHQEGTYTITLISGGTIQVPELRVEQIVEDEIVPEEPVFSTPPKAFKTIPLAFIEGAIDGIPYGNLFVHMGKEYDLNPYLLAAVARVESNFNPDALSHKGARGLMQLMPATCQRFRVSDPYNPSDNLRGAATFLAYLRNKFEDNLSSILAAYNAGEHTVERYKGPPAFKETRDFIAKVQSHAREFMESSGSRVSDPTARNKDS